MTPSRLSDEEIAHEVQNGDLELFGLLVERYEAKMMRYARKFLFGYQDSEDLVQEAFLKAYANIQAFDPKRVFSSWLYRIAHNEFLNAIKKKGREPLPFFDPDTLFPHPVSSDNPQQNLKDQEAKEILDKCLHKLDPKYREPLVLYYFEEIDYRAISEIMRIPVSTVGVRIKRGKDQLKKIYDQQFNS